MRVEFRGELIPTGPDRTSINGRKLFAKEHECGHVSDAILACILGVSNFHKHYVL